MMGVGEGVSSSPPSRGIEMGIRHRFDPEKAIEVLLYIARRCPNTYKALKVLYFADRGHLARYGRLICGDSYVAMRLGPVPSGAYDLIKDARGDRYPVTGVKASEAFAVGGNNQIVPKREARLDLLSESDVECLDAAIQEYGRLSFGELKRRSHEEEAFKEADVNDFMSLEAIARGLPNGELLLSYLQDG